MHRNKSCQYHELKECVMMAIVFGKRVMSYYGLKMDQVLVATINLRF